MGNSALITAKYHQGSGSSRPFELQIISLKSSVSTCHQNECTYLTLSTQQWTASVNLVYGTRIVAAYLDQLHAFFLCLGWNTLDCWLQILFSKGNGHFTTFPNLLSGYNTPVQTFWHCCTKLKSKCYIHFLCNRQQGFTLPTVTHVPSMLLKIFASVLLPIPSAQAYTWPGTKPFSDEQLCAHCKPLCSKGTTIPTITDHKTWLYNMLVECSKKPPWTQTSSHLTVTEQCPEETNQEGEGLCHSTDHI